MSRRKKRKAQQPKYTYHSRMIGGTNDMAAQSRLRELNNQEYEIGKKKRRKK